MIKRMIVAVLTALVTLSLLAAPASAAKGGKKRATNYAGVAMDPNAPSSITLDQPGPLYKGDAVTFTVNINPADLNGLKTIWQGGSIIDSWPMVYLQCNSVVDGTLLTGQLDHPDAVFVLGSGASVWFEQHDNAHCAAHLMVYEQMIEIAPPALFDAAYA